MPSGGLSSRVGCIFIKAGRRIYCPEKPGLGKLGGLARWRVELSGSFFLQIALPGAFSQTPDPTNSGPAWSAGGA